jgi:hypothetical protein
VAFAKLMKPLMSLARLQLKSTITARWNHQPHSSLDAAPTLACLFGAVRPACFNATDLQPRTANGSTSASLAAPNPIPAISTDFSWIAIRHSAVVGSVFPSIGPVSDGSTSLGTKRNLPGFCDGICGAAANGSLQWVVAEH